MVLIRSVRTTLKPATIIRILEILILQFMNMTKITPYGVIPSDITLKRRSDQSYVGQGSKIALVGQIYGTDESLEVCRHNISYTDIYVR
jgi:hypothetical protein